jgi:aspartyl protease family protein
VIEVEDVLRDEGIAKPTMGKAVRFALVAAVTLIAVGLIVSFATDRATAVLVSTGSGAHAAPAAAAPPTPTRNGLAPPSNQLVYRADPNGHFFVDAAVNGTTIRFLVDTGATVVALTPDDARAAGVYPAGTGFSQTMSTANGETHAAPTTLRDVRLEQLDVDNVAAVVMEQPMAISLLGMSFLKRLDGYSIRDGVLTIEW